MNALLQALGVDDEVSALRAIAEATSFITEARSATGKERYGEALVAIRQNAALAKSIGDLTERPAGESTGAVLAWKASHDARPQLEADLAEARASVEARDRAELIARGRSENKITPAQVEFWEKQSLDSLRGFLACASPVIPTFAREPAPGANGGPVLAKDYGDMTPLERHDLWKQVGDEAFAAIRAEHERKTNGG